MKKLLLIFLLTAFISFIVTSCDELFNTDDPEDNSAVPTKEFSTDQGGNLKAKNGSEIIVPTGAVTKNEDGENGKIIFTIDPNVKSEEYPQPIPGNYNLIGNVHHFGPSHFTFQYPIRVFLDGSSLQNLEGIYLIWYSELETKWVPIPISEIDATNKRLGSAVFELGYFAIVQDKQAIGGFPPGSEVQAYHRSGGARMQHPGNNEYYYTLFVAGFVPKYPEDAMVTYNNYSASTGSTLGGGGPRSVTHMVGLRPGNYTIVVARQKQGTLFNLPGPTQYYSVPAQITVNSFENIISWETESNYPWAEITLGGGEWQSGYPTIWPQANKSLGTGQLQITLSWTNISARIYTIDLFMYGPNNQNVSWHNPLSSDGSFALDRTSADFSVGYSVRNIYSKKNMPGGNYKVYVNIWGKHAGDGAMPFEVRIIRNGKFAKLIRSSISTLNGSEEIAKMLLVYEFNI